MNDRTKAYARNRAEIRLDRYVRAVKGPPDPPATRARSSHDISSTGRQRGGTNQE